jgi:tRNA 5-methylaminomethyl-2-thiouridine biosynthesis bifunctional protein
LVLEKSTICSGGSYPAGAFLSPKISKPSPYKQYLNDAFLYSTNFYKTHFPELFYQCGLKKVPLDEADIKKCESYEPFIDIACDKIPEGYFFPDAGIINPIKLCHALLEGIEVKEHYHVNDIDNFSCKHLILATGSDKLPIEIPYILTKNIAGYRYDVQFDDDKKQKYNIHKDLSISAFYNGCVAIGATHIKPSQVGDLKVQATNDTFGLLDKAKKLQPLNNLEILKTYTGFRNTTFDYFPIVGALIDAKRTLEHYPYIKTGTKVPTEKYHLFDKLYIHGGLGSRGFVYAPYNAKILTELIVNDKAIEEYLSPVRLFKKWAKKLP